MRRQTSDLGPGPSAVKPRLLTHAHSPGFLGPGFGVAEEKGVLWQKASAGREAHGTAGCPCDWLPQARGSINMH